MRNVLLASLAGCLLLAGCGSATPGCVTSFSLSVSVVNPVTGLARTSGSADHTQAPPGNQQQFLANTQATVVSGGCAVPLALIVVRPQWMVSDSTNLQISSANDTTNGLATCLGATTVPATVTATYTQGGTTKTATSTMICQ